MVHYNKKYTELKKLDHSPIKIGHLSVYPQELTHPGSVFAYAFEIKGKKFVCATDTEHKNVPDPRLIRIAQGADVLYYDAQYTPEEYQGTLDNSKFDWGHSTYKWAIKTALAARVSILVLAHHDPSRDDFSLEKIKEKALQFLAEQLKLPQNKGKKLKVLLAYQGLTLSL